MAALLESLEDFDVGIVPGVTMEDTVLQDVVKSEDVLPEFWGDTSSVKSDQEYRNQNINVVP